MGEEYFLFWNGCVADTFLHILENFKLLLSMVE